MSDLPKVIPDDWVFVIVRDADDPDYGKVSSASAHARYLLIRRGMTVGEFLAIDQRGNQPRKADITANAKAKSGQPSPNLVLAAPDTAEAQAARAVYLGAPDVAEPAVETVVAEPVAVEPVVAETAVIETAVVETVVVETVVVEMAPAEAAVSESIPPAAEAPAPMLDPKRSRLVCEVDFEKDGKQTGFVRLFHSVHASAYGFIPIPITVVKNGDGPTVLLVSGNHGDEYEGQVALCDLARTLDPEKIKGRVILLPMANFSAGMAGRRTSPIDEVNLNRAFPGDPDGTVTQQIAYWIESTLLPKANFVADLHSGGSSLMYMPSALAKLSGNPERDAAQRAMLEAFGAPMNYLSVGGSGTGQDNTLSGGAERLGIPAIGTELAGSGTVTPTAVRIARRGVNNLLVHAGILPASERIEPPGPPKFVSVTGPEHFVYASESGVWEPLVELGQSVKADQAAARIYQPETPWKPPAYVRFQADGIVLCKRIPGRTSRGDCLFHLGA